MVNLEKLGYDEVSKRDLYVLEIPTAGDLPPDLLLASPRFVCLIAWDAGNATDDEVSTLARRLLDAGAVYVCAWGPDCSRVHDIFDQVEIGPTPSPTIDRVVMTTSHDDEPLADAIFFALVCAYPDEGYEENCASTLGIAVGSPAWATEMRNAFSNPRTFVRQLTSEA